MTTETTISNMGLPAFNASEDAYTPTFLFAGDQEVISDRAAVANGQNLAARTVVAFNTAGALVTHDPTQTDSRAKAIGVLQFAVNASGGEVASAPFWIGGCFNHSLLVWHANLDTLAKRRAAFAGTNISVAAPL